jgi:uncharacterized SAM-binding protein YcdF (DUF218 family)
MSCRRRYVALLLTGGLLVGIYLARGQLLPLAARWLDVGERPRPADYAMVLGGGVNSRPFLGAALYRAGIVHKILVSHTASSSVVLDGVLPPEVDLTRRVLAVRGVPDGDVIVLGQDHDNTRDEAASLARFLETAPGARVIVVTSNYHTRRARWIFRRVLGPRASQVSFISTAVDEPRGENWWKDPEGFVMIAGENAKLAFYLLRYSPLSDKAALAAVVLLLVAVFYWRRRARSGRREDSGQPRLPTPNS